MTINELLSNIVLAFAELLARIVLAFSRMFDLITKGALGSLVLGDLGILAATVVVCLFIVGWIYTLVDKGGCCSR